MPTVAVDSADLFVRLGRTYTESEFQDLCFSFGIELDDVRDEATLATGKSRGGAARADGAPEAPVAAAASRTMFFIAIPANRTDLLCIEGLARAMNIFLQRATAPDFRTLRPVSPITLTVKPATQRIRPYVVAAVLRNVVLDAARYESFIDLQDKLHHNIGRRRTLVAIGTHDLDSVKPPFTYEARAPQDINFIPLSQSRSYRADELMTFYRTAPEVKHIKPYVDIIAHSDVYPVILDSEGTVLSLPPIINGEHSKIDRATTRNIFIECTATDLAKAHTVLNTVVGMFSEYAGEVFTAEAVQIVYEAPVRGVESGTCDTPQMASRQVSVDMRRLRGLIGVEIDAPTAAALASRMQLAARVADDATLEVTVPPTRADVLHEVDVIEDVAIAFGYNAIPRVLPATPCPGKQQPVNKLTDLLRGEMASAGYTECLTFALVSRADNYTNIKLPADDKDAVVLLNPSTEEFQVCRTQLIAGLLNSLASNKSTAIAKGVKLFEITDVVLLDATTDVGARNERRAAALYSGNTAGFEVMHGVVDRIMQLLEIPHRPFAWEVAASVPAAASAAAPAPAATYGRGGWRYHVDPDDSVPTYFPGRGATITLENLDGRSKVIGSLGVVHPHVLKAFELVYPASVMEMCIEDFVGQ